MPLASTPISGYTTLPKGNSGWGTLGNFGLQALGTLAGSIFNQGGQQSQQPQQRQPAGGFWSSNGGAAAISGLLGLGGGILGGIGDSKAQDAQLALTREQLAQQNRQWEAEQARAKDEFAKQAAQRAAEFGATDLYNRQKTGAETTQMDPLLQQRSRQNAAVFASLLGNARNIGMPDGSNGFMPTGGLRLPEGGFGEDVTRFSTPEARAEAEGNFYKTVAPFAQGPDLSKVGYGEAGVKPTQAAQSYYESELAKRRGAQAAMTGALDPSQSTIPATANRDWLGRAMKTSNSMLTR